MAVRLRPGPISVGFSVFLKKIKKFAFSRLCRINGIDGPRSLIPLVWTHCTASGVGMYQTETGSSVFIVVINKVVHPHSHPAAGSQARPHSVTLYLTDASSPQCITVSHAALHRPVAFPGPGDLDSIKLNLFVDFLTRSPYYKKF